MAEKLSAEDKKYRARMDLEHLTHAEKIKGDPDRMRHVQRAATEQVKALSKVLPKPAARTPSRPAARPASKRK
jgi:hypothetical protein